jgi:predicted hotdog family 3-hydroxylacyl-ACP dehydratase
MVLIDRITAADTDSFTAQVDIRPSSPFYVSGHGVPSYVGIEYIAQTVSAYSGWCGQQQAAGAAPRLGFLLGTRKMLLAEPWFALGAVLEVQISKTFDDGEMGVFDGEIRHDGRVMVSATISVYQPTDSAQAFGS